MPKGNYDARMSAANGTFTVNDTTEKEIDFTAIYFPEDTVISSIKVNGNATNVISDYVSTPATAIKAGTLKVIQGDDYGSAITLSSGSVELVKKTDV